MSSKETPKKVYQAPSSALFDPLSCRLCRNIGDASHRVKIFNPNNQQLLTIAEKLCGRSIVAHSSLPNVICRPCEQRLKNILEFQKVILKSDGEFREATEVNLNVRVKPLCRSLSFHFSTSRITFTGNRAANCENFLDV